VGDLEPPPALVDCCLVREELVTSVRLESAQHGEDVGWSPLAPFAESASGLLHCPAIDWQYSDLPTKPVQGLPSGGPGSRGTPRGQVGELEEVHLGRREFDPAKPCQEIPRPLLSLEEG